MFCPSVFCLPTKTYFFYLKKMKLFVRQIALIDERRGKYLKHDIEIVKKAIKGDAQALETLLLLEQNMLYYKALSYVSTKEDALDAIQETSYHALLSIHQLRHPEYFSTWLFRIL